MTSLKLLSAIPLPVRNLFVAIATLAAAANSSNAQATHPGVAHVLDADTRLQRAISMDTEGISLRELCDVLTDKTVEFSVGSEVSALRLQIVLKKRPLRTLMRAIAELAPGQWETYDKGRGYVFHMSEEAVKRRKDWWRLYLSERDAAMDAQRQYVLKVLETKPGNADFHDMSAQQTEMIQDKLNVYHGLPSELRKRIADHCIDSLLYSTRRIAVSDGSMNEGAITAHVADLSPAIQDSVRRWFVRSPNARDPIAENATLVFENEGTLVTMGIIHSDGKEGFSCMNLGVGSCPDMVTLPLGQDGVVQVVAHMGKSAPVNWKRLAQYRNSRVWPAYKAADPLKLPRADPPARGSMCGPPRLADRLNWLKQCTPVEFVSDYYDRPCRPLTDTEKAQKLAGPLPLELNALGTEQDLSWKRIDEDIYLFRSNRWYRDDGLQVPASQIKPWLRMLTAARIPQEGLNPVNVNYQERKMRMDLEAQIVASLTPYQIAGGLEWYSESRTDGKSGAHQVFPFAGFAERLLHERYTALFYGSLSEELRQRIIEGKLSTSELSAEQMVQAAFLRPALADLKPGQMALLGIRPKARGSFFITPADCYVDGIEIAIVAATDQAGK